MKRFRIDSREVAHETIDGEVIVIQLRTGNYYSLAGTGAAIWRLLGLGWSTDEIAAKLEPRYAGRDAPEAVEALARELAAEQLIEPAADDGPPDRADTAFAEGAEPLAPPVLEKYTDMQDFL